MHRVRLGKTNLMVPVCGVGGIPVGRDHLSDEQGAALVARAIDDGLALVDTFSGYGRSEIRIGMALKGRREQVTLVTKSRSRHTPEEFEEQIEISLGNMQVDCIDVLLLKNVDNDVCVGNVEDHVEVLRRFQDQGKVRFTGLSSHSPGHACEAIETGLIDVAEVPYNYANPFFEEVLDLAAERNVGILAMKPLGGGRIFGNAEKGAPETLGTLVDALSFASSHPSNPVLIPGIGSEVELGLYLQAVPRIRRLTDEEKDELRKRAVDLGADFCRACGYCRSVCPSGLPIDDILPLLDRVKHVQTDNTFKKQLKERFLTLRVDAEACRECRKCVEECPFDLPVPERIKEAFGLFEAK